MRRIDFEIQLINLLPKAVRDFGLWVMDFMRVVAKALQTVHDKYFALTTDYDEYLDYNNLRKRLEDRLRAELNNPGITVINLTLNVPLVLYQKSESLSVKFHQKSEGSGTVATQLSEPKQLIGLQINSAGSDINLIKALVEQYKILGVKYKIV